MLNKKKMPKKKTCDHPDCKKKIGLVKFPCKCGKTFCSLHRLAENHNCTFDYISEGRKKIENDNPVVKTEKIIAI